MVSQKKIFFGIAGYENAVVMECFGDYCTRKLDLLNINQAPSVSLIRKWCISSKKPSASNVHKSSLHAHIAYF